MTQVLGSPLLHPHPDPFCLNKVIIIIIHMKCLLWHRHGALHYPQDSSTRWEPLLFSFYKRRNLSTLPPSAEVPPSSGCVYLTTTLWCLLIEYALCYLGNLLELRHSFSFLTTRAKEPIALMQINARSTDSNEVLWG